MNNLHFSSPNSFKILPKLYVSEKLSKLSSKKKLLLIAFGFTNKSGIQRLKEMWASVDRNKKAVGRDKNDTEKLGPIDMGGAITLVDLNISNHDSFEVLAEIDVMTPMGLHYFSETSQLLVGSAYSVKAIKGGKIVKDLRNNLFSQVHVISKTKRGVLAACTNTDAIVEFHPQKSSKSLWSWLATENGFDINPKGAHRIIDRKINYQSREDYGTRNHTTHVNSALEYDDEHVLATLFHQSFLVKISKKDGTCEVIFDKLINPHGIHRTKNGFILSDTKGGRVILLDKNLKFLKAIKGDFDWVQDAIEFGDYYLVGNDNNGRIDVYSKMFRKVTDIDWGIDNRKLSAMIEISAGDAKKIFLAK